MTFGPAAAACPPASDVPASDVPSPLPQRLGTSGPPDDAEVPSAMWLSRAYGAGEASPDEVVAMSLRRAQALPGAFTLLLEEEARQEARRSAERWATGSQLSAVDGVPVAVKDCFDVAGTVTTSGSLVAASARPATQDAAVVARLRRAGAVIIAKTNLSELAFSGLGVNPHFGTPPNPTSGPEPLVPGGSSSGSAVAVASGVVPLALGTDTSGSVRVPGAFCGVVGYKASEDAFSRRGMRPLAPTLDSVGFLSRTVTDLGLLLGILGAPPELAPPEPLRLVVPDQDLVSDCHPVVSEAFAAALARLAEDGRVAIERRRIEAFHEAQALMAEHGTIVAAEAHQHYGRLLEPPTGRRLDPDVARRLGAAADVGRSIQPMYGALPRLRAKVARELDGALLVCPTVRQPPPPLRDVIASAAAFDTHNTRTLMTTMLLSNLGMPGISLPLNSGGHGGVGLLVSGAPLHDPQVVGAARLLEELLLAPAGR